MRRIMRKTKKIIILSVLVLSAIKGLDYIKSNEVFVEDIKPETIEITAKAEKPIVVEKITPKAKVSVQAQEDTDTVVKSNNIYDDIPAFSGESFYVINGDNPNFTDKEKENLEAFEEYSELDSLGRCGVAYANICTELMPTEKRKNIGHIKPSGWNQAKYQEVKDFEQKKSFNDVPGYLYNRCHLIGFQLAGENDNEKNLITGTRYLNISGMLDVENLVAEYVKETGNHVLYRVSPIFIEDELVCRGVTIEAYSVEDMGEGIELYRFFYNVQPGIEIDYKTGKSYVN